MPLEYLNLTALPVSDLSPLGGLKSLRMLILDSTPVSDLKPLEGLPLPGPAIRSTRVEDLTPIKGMPLKKLWLDYRPDREKFLRSLTGLELINEKPAADFWKEVDGK
jgi:Leucine-rich repeat (LRR) protein